MATIEEIDRLTAQLARLSPLAEARPGELIMAEAWNTVVDVLVDLARALIEEQERPVRPHDHPDQVQLGWLDPRLRQLLEGGPLADPASVARVDSLERDAQRQQEALDELATHVKELRERGREISTRDLERDAAVSIVRRKVEGIADGRDDVLDVRESLNALRGRVERAVQLAEDLESHGQAVDLGALQERVKLLDELRERLKLPSGETLDGATFERRLAELRNLLVDDEKLDEALAAHHATLDPEQEAALEERLQASVDTRLAAGLAALRAEVEARIDERLTNLDQRVQQALADATPGLTEGILAQARGETQEHVAKALGQAIAALRVEVGASVTGLRAEIANAVNGLRLELEERVAAIVDERVQPLLRPLHESIEGTQQGLGFLARRIERAEASIGGLEARVARLEEGLNERLAGLQADVDTRLSEAVNVVTRDLADHEARVNRAIDERGLAAEAASEERLQSELDERDMQLRADLAGIASDQLAGLEDRLPGIVSTQIETSAAAAVRRIAETAVDDRLRNQ